MTAADAGVFAVSFPGSGHPPVRLPGGAPLSAHLTPANSPLLFGCRTGICGTCAVAVTVGDGGALPPPSADEAEVLDVVCPERPGARLACQIDLRADIAVAPVAAGVPG
jgi:ferredoxin